MRSSGSHRRKRTRGARRVETSSSGSHKAAERKRATTRRRRAKKKIRGGSSFWGVDDEDGDDLIAFDFDYHGAKAPSPPNEAATPFPPTTPAAAAAHHPRQHEDDEEPVTKASRHEQTAAQRHYANNKDYVQLKRRQQRAAKKAAGKGIIANALVVREAHTQDRAPLTVGNLKVALSHVQRGHRLRERDFQIILDEYGFLAQTGRPTHVQTISNLDRVLLDVLQLPRVNKDLRAELLLCQLMIATWFTPPPVLLTTDEICAAYGFNRDNVAEDATLPAFLWYMDLALSFAEPNRDLVSYVIAPLSDQPPITRHTASVPLEPIGTVMRHAAFSARTGMERSGTPSKSVVDRYPQRKTFHPYKSTLPAWNFLNWSQKVPVLVRINTRLAANMPPPH